MKARIAVLGGDGIGPEVTAEAVRVLQAVADRFGHEFEFAAALIGGAAIDASGSALPPRTIDACRESAATLRKTVSRMRQRFRQHMKAELAPTLDDGATADDEMRALLEALSNRSPLGR